MEDGREPLTVIAGIHQCRIAAFAIGAEGEPDAWYRRRASTPSPHAKASFRPESLITTGRIQASCKSFESKAAVRGRLCSADT